jgi:cytochrome c oxidase subunit 2
MKAMVVVHASRADYERWLSDASDFIAKLPPEKLSEGGQKLYNQRGCKQCHSIDGSPGTGPSFKGIFGHDQPLREGGVARVDENYIRQSIVDPHSQIVAGYEAVMPSFQGRLKDKEITALIEYIKTLK